MPHQPFGAQPCNHSRVSRRLALIKIRNTISSAQKTPTPPGVNYQLPRVSTRGYAQLINPARQTTNHSCRINLLARNLAHHSRVSRRLALNQITTNLHLTPEFILKNRVYTAPVAFVPFVLKLVPTVLCLPFARAIGLSYQHTRNNDPYENLITKACRI